MSRVLVTGGAGFVGRHLCKKLLDSGYDVTCVDPIVEKTGGIHPNEWPLYKPFDYKNFSFFQEDCRSFFKKNEKFDIIFHLAAMVGGRLMIEYDPLAVAEDLAIDADFFRFALRTKPKKSVFFSSSAAYPISLQTRDNYRLLSEKDIHFSNDLGMPDLSYGWAKLTGEYLAQLAYKHYDLDVVCYRPFSGYGEDQDLSYPFPSICKRVLEYKDAEKISVWGTGEQMRDFIHITDCIEFVIKSMDLISDGSSINLSTGKLTSFKQFAKTAANIVGYNPIVIGTSNKPEGVFARGGERNLQEKLGLYPSVTFEEGISRGIEFQKSQNR